MSLSATGEKTGDVHNAAGSASARPEPGEVGNGLPVVDTQRDSQHQNSRDKTGEKQPAVLEQRIPRREADEASAAAAVIDVRTKTGLASFARFFFCSVSVNRLAPAVQDLSSHPRDALHSSEAGTTIRRQFLCQEFTRAVDLPYPV